MFDTFWKSLAKSFAKHEKEKQMQLTFPVKNILPNTYRKFNYNNTHTGDDERVILGENVFSIADGIVIYSSRLTPGYGGYDERNKKNRIKGGCVWIKHIDKFGRPFLAQYGHVTSELKVGDKVHCTDCIGKIHSYFYTNKQGVTEDLIHIHFSIYVEADDERKNKLNKNGTPKGNWGYIKNPVRCGYKNTHKFIMRRL